ncbi:hypothetical protein NDQ53_01345 [Rossellomorea marisflavi]|uniref:hypothetical protein n=1 Tax=Rossellomorea marisflavi TaxID=189381 RepID=UPI00203E2E84|nr:hypothetical protein [Rossellomorea marisflavi]MCM2587946.1 hypothetical protein [Rossellomorea marisflavi]
MKYILMIASALFLLVGCSHKEEIKKESLGETRHAPDTSMSNEATPVSTNENPTTTSEHLISISKDPIDHLTPDSYELTDSSCPKGMIAPSYITDQSIFYVDDQSSEQPRDQIIAFSRSSETCDVLYEATEGINSLVGIDQTLYWTEYDTRRTSDVSWTIHALDLDTGKVQAIHEGESTNENPTPILTTHDQSLNWIQYEVKDDRVISQVINYDANTDKKSTLVTTELNENGSPNGDYILEQKRTGNSLLLHKAISKDGERRLTLERVADDEEHTLLTDEEILSFDGADDRFAYTSDEGLTIVDSGKEETYRFKTTSKRTPSDAAVFVNPHTVAFRDRTENVYLADLDTRIALSLRRDGFGHTATKPIYFNDTLCFAVLKEESLDESVTFYTYKMK